MESEGMAEIFNGFHRFVDWLIKEENIDLIGMEL